MNPLNLETTLLLSITGICWGTAAWLFWKWDIGGYRTEFQLRKKKQQHPGGMNDSPNNFFGGNP